MKIKESLILVSLASLAGFSTSAQAAPLVSIGDNVDVFFNGSSSVKWDSNVFYDDDDETDDLLLTVSPGFEVNVGRGLSNLDLSIITRYDIVRYDDLSHLDSEYFHIKAISSYKTSRWDVSGLVSFDEERSTSGEQSTASRGKLVESDNTRANLNGEYRISPKFSVASGVNYYNKEYTSNHADISDRESYRIPVDVYYELTPKIDLSVGYQYTTTDVGSTIYASSYDQDRHFFNVGARGDLLPKLSGQFKIGYTALDSDDSTIYATGGKTDRDSSGTLGLDADFTYLLTPKVTTRLALSRDFGTGSQGQGLTQTDANLSASYSINTNYSASAYFNYSLDEYEETNRDDNTYRTGLRLSYVPNRYWRFSTGYAYSERDSDIDGQDYENHTIDLSASLRY